MAPGMGASARTILAVAMALAVLMAGGGARAQFGGVTLEASVLFQPALTRCVLPDVRIGPYINTTCTLRSDGCITANLNCQLSISLGYTLHAQIVTITPTIWWATNPTAADGMVAATVKFTQPAQNYTYTIDGYLQLWQYASTDPVTLIDTYVFTKREQYLLQLPTQTFVTYFKKVPAGKYLLAYWDMGGTRYGSGIPETTNPFVVQAVFPSVPLAVKIMPQALGTLQSKPCDPFNFATNTTYIANIYTKIYNLYYQSSTYLSYYLDSADGSVNLEQYILNLEAMSNRKLIWLQESDMGNRINVKTDPLPPSTGKYPCNTCNAAVNMTQFCARCGSPDPPFGYYESPACASCPPPGHPVTTQKFCDFCGGTTNGFCNMNSTVQIDSMLYFKIYPMTTGGYGTVADATKTYPDTAPNGNPNGYWRWRRLSQGRKSRVSARLAYVGFPGTEYGDYWDQRQAYFDTTVIAARTLDIVQVDMVSAWDVMTAQPGWCDPPPHPCYNNGGGVGGVADTSAMGVSIWNHVEYVNQPALNGGEDLLVWYYFSYHGTQRGFVSNGGLAGQWADSYMFVDQFRNLYPNGLMPQPADTTPTRHSYCVQLNNEGTASFPCDTISGQLFLYNITFAWHDNDVDATCWALGSNYSTANEGGQQLHPPQSPNTYFTDPCLLYQNTENGGQHQPCNAAQPQYSPWTRAPHYTFADIYLGMENAEAMFGDCETGPEMCPENTIFVPIGCLNQGVPQCCTLPALQLRLPVDGECVINPLDPPQMLFYPSSPATCCSSINILGFCVGILEPTCCSFTFYGNVPVTQNPQFVTVQIGDDPCTQGPAGTLLVFPTNSYSCSGSPIPVDVRACCQYQTANQPEYIFPQVGKPCTSPWEQFQTCGTCCNAAEDMYNFAALGGNFATNPYYEWTNTADKYGIYTPRVMDTVCAGFMPMAASNTNIYIGSSGACPLETILGQQYGFTNYFGFGNSDASNQGHPLGTSNVPYPLDMPRQPPFAIKDCAAGSYPWPYANMEYRLHNFELQINAPFNQLKVSYSWRGTAIDNPITQPVFIVPSNTGTLLGEPLILAPVPTAPRTRPAAIGLTTNSGSSGESTITIGLDTTLLSFQYEQNVYYDGVRAATQDYQSQLQNVEDVGLLGKYDVMAWNVQLAASYARFRVYPLPIFLNFENAVPQRGTLPATIDVRFQLACPYLGFAQWGRSSTPAPCAEGWTITNQAQQAIVVGVQVGSLAPDADPLSQQQYAYLVAGPMPLQNQIFGGGYDGQQWVVTVAYQQGDVLHWEFNLRPEPEKPQGPVSCHYSTVDVQGSTVKLTYAPDPVTVAVPPQQDVFSTMECRVDLAAPACVYDSPNMIVFCVRGAFYSWLNILADNLPQIGGSGAPSGIGVNDQYIYYYYKWTLIGQGVGGTNLTIQGFGQQYQVYSPPFVVQVCDRVMCLQFASSDLGTPPPASTQNPLSRPLRCTDETINNATCPVNVLDPPLQYSGIDQDPYCLDPVAGVNAVLLTARLVCSAAFPQCQLDQIGSYFFYVSTAYQDPLNFAQTHNGVFAQINQFVVSQASQPSDSVVVALWVEYFTSLSQSEDQCYDNLLTQVYIPSSFVAGFGTIQYIPNCIRSDGCCYFVPLVVAGTSPVTGNLVTLTGVSAPYNAPGNATDPCYGAGACVYEVIVNPPLNANGGVCLGATYTFTIQTPQALVNAREGPVIGIGNQSIYNSSQFKYPYRCPTTLTAVLPTGGFSPVTYTTVPGTCVEPGTDASFALNYENPACSGPVTAQNPDPNCRLDVYFTLTATDGDTTYQNMAGGTGGGFSTGQPWLLTGQYALTYNAPGVFEFPQFFTPPFLGEGGFPPIPNGYWNASFWVQAAGSVATPPTGGWAAQADPRNRVSVILLAGLAGTEGLNVEQQSLVIPRCPTSGFTISPPVVATFVITDLSYRGPYAVTWRTPNGQLIAAQNYTCAGQPCATNCTDIDPEASFFENPAAAQSTCDLIMQTQGITVVAYVGTGPQSPRQGGPNPFLFNVYALGSQCDRPYGVFMNSLDEIIPQIVCQPTTCAGGNDGNVLLSVQGGTPNDFIIQQQYVLGAHFTQWLQYYNLNWTTPEGYLLGANVLAVPEGLYIVNGTDAHGCPFSAACVVGTADQPLVLTPCGSTPPNCTGDVGTATFCVSGGVPPYTLMKVGNQTVNVSAGGTVLADPSVVPDQTNNYVVVDANGCTSPEVSFTLGGPIAFAVSARVTTYPCSTNTATGQILASVSPPGLGTVLTWTNVNTGQIVYSNGNTNINSIGNPYLSNVPAATYALTATALLYGCQKTVFVNLQARLPPQITIVRQSVSALYDLVRGNVVSDNGPPYSFVYQGLLPQTQPNQLQIVTAYSLLGTVMDFTISNLLGSQTFTIQVTDAGGCVGFLTTYGRAITEQDVLQTNSKLPEPTPRPSHSQSPTPGPAGPERRMKLEIAILVFIAIVSVVSLLAICIGAYRYANRPPSNIQYKNL